jgi:hypothetical protein
MGRGVASAVRAAGEVGGMGILIARGIALYIGT